MNGRFVDDPDELIESELHVTTTEVRLVKEKAHHNPVSPTDGVLEA